MKTLDKILGLMKINKIENDPQQRAKSEVFNQIQEYVEGLQPLTQKEFYAVEIQRIYSMEEFKTRMLNYKR